MLELIFILLWGCSSEKHVTIEKTPEPQKKEQQIPQSDLFVAINKARIKRGMLPVLPSPALDCAAMKHAMDLAATNECRHEGSDGSTPWQRASSCGGSADGEIVACGQDSAEAAVTAWSMSPGHAAILFDRRQTKVGVYVYDKKWVALFE